MSESVRLSLHGTQRTPACAKVGSRRDPTSQRWLDGPLLRTVPAGKPTSAWAP